MSTVTGAEPTATAQAETPTPAVPVVPRIKILSDSFIQTYPSNRSCFVLGATGETGKRITRDLINSGAFSLIKVVTRRQVDEEFLPEPSEGVKIVHEKLLCFLIFILFEF